MTARDTHAGPPHGLLANRQRPGGGVLDHIGSEPKTKSKNEVPPSATAPTITGHARRDGWAEHRMAERQRGPSTRSRRLAPGPICAAGLSRFSSRWNSLPTSARAKDFERDLAGRFPAEREEK